jgi:hypothetical protein
MSTGADSNQNEIGDYSNKRIRNFVRTWHTRVTSSILADDSMKTIMTAFNNLPVTRMRELAESRPNSLPHAQFPSEEKRAPQKVFIRQTVTGVTGTERRSHGRLHHILNSSWICVHGTQTFTTTCRKSNKRTLHWASSIHSTTSQHILQDSFLYYRLLCTWVVTAQSVWDTNSGVHTFKLQPRSLGILWVFRRFCQSLQTTAGTLSQIMLKPLPFVSCSFNYLLFIKVVTLNNLIDMFTASRSY